jgi:hypothetical protein
MSEQQSHSRDVALDVSDYTVATVLCPDCQQHYARVTGYVSQGDISLAAYYAVCHGHPNHEVSLDMMFGTWGTGDMSDHETFSCRVRPDGAVVVDPFVTVSLDPRAEDLPAIFGRTVPRDEALAHPMLRRVWTVVDALVLGVPPIAEQYNSR